MTPLRRHPSDTLGVVLFTGGRGSGLLSAQLIRDPRIRLTLVINGYDDGASTGEIRRFLGDALGPSDFRKNSTRLASQLQTGSDALVELLEMRLPGDCTPEAGSEYVATLSSGGSAADATHRSMKRLLDAMASDEREGVTRALDRFASEQRERSARVDFADCSVGNIVFAGCFLESGRDMNRSIARFAGLLGIPDGMIENVTAGENAYLVAIDREGRLICSEAEIVSSTRRNRIREIHLIDHAIDDDERQRLADAPGAVIETFLADHRVAVTPNPRVIERLANADVIIYAPGTQHSSLFPSYITPGVGEAIASNHQAIKLLITNIREDAEIADASAVDLIEKAVHYLRGKSRLHHPTPCFITHYLLNDPASRETDQPYVPLGAVDALEDPRLVRVGHFEEGVSGRHDATAVLTPFVESYLRRPQANRIVVLLLGTESVNKIMQSVLEALREAGPESAGKLSFLYASPDSIDAHLAAELPFELVNVHRAGRSKSQAFAGALAERNADYVILFESSGRYRGEEIVALADQLSSGRLDAAWGSRRLSVRDIQASYRLRYRRKRLLGAISYLGSQLLSLAYLAAYGRYVSDSLCGVRAVRASLIRQHGIDLDARDLNQRLLTSVLGRRGEMLELPVQFFTITPDKDRRITIADGFRAVWLILTSRWRRDVTPTAGAPVAPVAGRRLHVIDLVIFDLDGVLIDSSPAHAAAYRELYDALGVPERPYAGIAGRSTRSVVRELLDGRDDANDSLERWVGFKQDAARRHLDRPGLVFPDAGPALDALRALNLPVAIGTSASRTTSQAVLRAAAWEGRFAAVVTADDVHAAKPDPRIYTRVMELAAAAPERTLIVEDSAAGLQAAAASGAWVVSVRSGERIESDRFLGAYSDLACLADLITRGGNPAWTASS